MSEKVREGFGDILKFDIDGRAKGVKHLKLSFGAYKTLKAGVPGQVGSSGHESVGKHLKKRLDDNKS